MCNVRRDDDDILDAEDDLLHDPPHPVAPSNEVRAILDMTDQEFFDLIADQELRPLLGS